MTARPALDRKRYLLTDVGNAQRLVDSHGKDIRWVARWRQWIVWDGRRWARDELGEVERRAKGCVRDMIREAADLDGEKRSSLIAHALKSESRSHLESMVALARSEPGVAISHDDLDRHVLSMTVRNGTLDLATGKLGPHQRSHMSTKLADIEYDPAARCDLWESTLHTLMGGDLSLIEYLQRAFGYSLTGDTRERVLHLCVGTGSNGKSTVLDVFEWLMGDYGRTADFATFLDTARSGSGPSSDVARLASARMVRSSEVGENKRLNEGLIKSLTGSDTITARFLRSEDFEFRPQFKLWLAANHKPVIRGTDYAIWQRMRLVPFDVTITPEQRDDSLPKRLREELSGILAWCAAGCVRWLEMGLSAPVRVLAATKEYRTESDSIGTFIDERCEVGASFSVSASELYKAYNQWAKDSGEWIVSSQMLGRRLGERGYESKHTMNGKMRLGLRLGASQHRQGDDDENFFDRENP